MSSFKERFKDKTSVVGKDGEHRQAPPPLAAGAAPNPCPPGMSSPPFPARSAAGANSHSSTNPVAMPPRGGPPVTATAAVLSAGPPPAGGVRVEKKSAAPTSAAPVAMTVVAPVPAPRASFSLPTGFQPTGMFPTNSPPPLLVDEPSPTSPPPAAISGKKSKGTERHSGEPGAKKSKPGAPPPAPVAKTSAAAAAATAAAAAAANASTGSSLPPPLESTAKPSLVAPRVSEAQGADVIKSHGAAASSSPTKGSGLAANARKTANATGAPLLPAAALTPPPPATLANHGGPQSVLAALRERSLLSHPAAAVSSPVAQPPQPVQPKPAGGARRVAGELRGSPHRDAAAAAVRPRSDPSPSRDDHPRREITYKPYGVEDYRRMKDELAKKVSGGLGPSDTDEQRAAAARLQRQREYAENIKRINQVMLLHQSASDDSGVGEDGGDGATPTTSPRPARRNSQVHVPQETLEKQQRRERAIAYAKNVPKPKLRISREDDPILQPQPGHDVPLVLDKEGQTRLERERALADLEAKHEQDQRMVDNIKKQLRL